MITWMQRHKRWLIITIWVSTIAFVGAGFVGWGQYSYGDKAGAVAKVGSIEITQGELQKTYSRLYARYNRMFKGNFDEEKAKQFGLQSQALEQLEQKALILNLAQSYDLQISDKELIKNLKKQDVFFKDGHFDKETYKQVLSQNRLSTKEYEEELKSDLLVQKTLALLPIEVTQNEVGILNVLSNIADKINYKVLTKDAVTLDTSDAKLKLFWQQHTRKFMNDVSYDLEYIIQDALSSKYEKNQIATYYKENRSHFKGENGKILALNDAKNMIINELNEKATKDKALRIFIAYKKNKLTPDIQKKNITLSQTNNSLNNEVFEKVSKLSLTAPYLKPILVNGVYHIIKLTKINPATTKTFDEAKTSVLKLYTQEMSKQELQTLAQNSIDTFSGKTTNFITLNDATALNLLNKDEAKEFLQQLFISDKKRSYINLNNGKIVLYYILEQKLLDKSNKELKSSMKKLKDGIFGEALVKSLKEKYPTEIFIQGL